MAYNFRISRSKTISVSRPTSLPQKKILLFLWALLQAAVAQAQYESQIKGITQELSKKVAETSKKRIAVADFTDPDGTVTKLGQFISEEFNTYLPEAGQGFEVIDRTRINTLIRENQLLRKGLTDPTAAAQLGKLAGIEALVYGTITPFGESVRTNIKILDIQRGVIIRSLVGNITRTADINRLLGDKAPTPGLEEEKENAPDSNFKVPKTAADCAVKRTCVVCATNQLTQNVKANIGYWGPTYYVHPNETKCWQDVPIGNSDHNDIHIRYLDDNNALIKFDNFVIEPCKTYKRTLAK